MDAQRDDWDIHAVCAKFQHELEMLGFSHDGAYRYVDGIEHTPGDETARRAAITYALWDYDLLWIIEQAAQVERRIVRWADGVTLLEAA